MKIIISLLSVLIFSLLVLTYVKISKPNFIWQKYEEKKVEIKTSKPEKFPEISNFEYNALPARVLYEKIDFKKIKTVILYKIIIKGTDRFSLFNVLEILKTKKVPYSMIKQKNVSVYVIFKNLKEAENILNLFKNYNFPIKLQKIIKRI
ncbi:MULTISPECIES: hypothetical protein [unclassified Lebetimonas]|uniref:hypothetical protein n=1 Tax=unclassified Lebetimonas TaxID=2648158 RepID=UPI0004638489|nr:MULTISPECIES: hypothetical protein [unclassified Lebetimonas]